MGTNFYLVAKARAIAELYSDNIDEDTLIHIAKTSAGWLPLFQQHKHLNSVADILNAIDNGLKVIDEYDTSYTKEQFIARVVRFNGGAYGAERRVPIQLPDDKSSPFYDSNMEGLDEPISHIEYARGAYADDYYRDPQGYEFCKGDFC